MAKRIATPSLRLKRRAAFMRALRKADAAGMSVQDLGLRFSLSVEQVRRELLVLRDAKRAGNDGSGHSTRWYVADIAERRRGERAAVTAAAQEAKRRRAMKERLAAEEAEAALCWADLPMLHRVVPLAQAPKVERTKPHSIFTLAA